MKILYNIGRFDGGAPLSILEYANIAKKHGNDVLAVGEFATSENKYKKLGITVYNNPYFILPNPIKSLASIYGYIKIIRKERPDIIHATSYGIIPSKFVGKCLGIPVMYSIAGGNHIKVQIEQGIFEDEKLIVYSEENRIDLTDCGYPPEKIEVISNRLSIEHNDIVVKNNSNELRAVLISRLDNGLIQSVENVINIIAELAGHSNNLYLDIIGSGELKENIKKIADSKNKLLGRSVINIHGYQENVSDFINNADIVFGKGRSIIEPILHKKIAFIIGEDNKISRCTTRSIPNLYKYNFSGRNIEFPTEIEEIDFILRDIISNNFDYSQLEEVRDMVDELYNIEHAEERIIELYEEKSCLIDSTIKQPLQAIIYLIKLYWYGAFSKLRRNFGTVK